MNNKLRIVCSIYIFRNDPDTKLVIVDIYQGHIEQFSKFLLLLYIYIHIYILFVIDT